MFESGCPSSQSCKSKVQSGVQNYSTLRAEIEFNRAVFIAFSIFSSNELFVGIPKAGYLTVMYVTYLLPKGQIIDRLLLCSSLL